MHAPVAQLDRVPGYEPGGREFESLRARKCFQRILKYETSEPIFYSNCEYIDCLTLQDKDELFESMILSKRFNTFIEPILDGATGPEGLKTMFEKSEDKMNHIKDPDAYRVDYKEGRYSLAC